MLLIKQVINELLIMKLSSLLLSKYRKLISATTLKEIKDCKESKTKIKLHHSYFNPSLVSIAMAFGGNCQ